MATQSTLLDPSIFADLESKIDEEARVRDALTQIVQKLQRTVALAQALLARVHSTPRARCELVAICCCNCLSLPVIPFFWASPPFPGFLFSQFLSFSASLNRCFPVDCLRPLLSPNTIPLLHWIPLPFFPPKVHFTRRMRRAREKEKKEEELPADKTHSRRQMPHW